MILATVASKGPAISFSKVAFVELEQSLALFEKVATHPVVKHSLVSWWLSLLPNIIQRFYPVLAFGKAII